jgi:hypothetical protein
MDAGGDVTEVNATDSVGDPIVEYDKVLPPFLQIDTPFDPYIESVSLAVGNLVVKIGFYYSAIVANAAALVAYHIKPWVPVGVMSSTFQALTALGIVGFGYAFYTHYRNLLKEALT